MNTQMKNIITITKVIDSLKPLNKRIFTKWILIKNKLTCI